MQIHLFKQNSINTSKGNVSTLSVIFSAIIILLTIGGMIAVPGYVTLSGGIILISAITRYMILNLNKKPLLLEITGNDIIYMSEHQKEPITIHAEDIVSITHKFCELRICTKDEAVHYINLMNTKSEQTRWEIKELLKGFGKKLN